MKRILIAEDDPMISEIYQKKFSEGGFEVAAATSGDLVLSMAKKDIPDVILLDLMMPKMDGFQIIENIRKGNFDPNIKIIVSSNLSQNEDRERALNLGANGFVSKSDFTPGNLVKEVSRLLGQFEEQGKNEEKQKNASTDEAVSKDESDAKARILMIEDEDIFIEMFGNKLKEAGYAVDSAQNGAWGVKEAMEGNYDLFIIDMIMPAMTGEEMINRLKLDDKTKNVPIIMLSASIDEADAGEVMKLGIQAFLKKTQITPTDLVKKVAEVLKK
jgi:two-component system cell cycle response regulator